MALRFPPSSIYSINHEVSSLESLSTIDEEDGGDKEEEAILNKHFPDDGHLNKVQDEEIYEKRNMIDFNRRVRNWFIQILLITTICFIFLVTLIALYNRYTSECDSKHTFGEFSMCVLAYLLLIYMIDVITAGISWRITSKLVGDDSTLDRINRINRGVNVKGQEEPPEEEGDVSPTTEGLGIAATIDNWEYKLIQNCIQNTQFQRKVDKLKALEEISSLNQIYSTAEPNLRYPSGDTPVRIPGHVTFILGINTISIITCFFWIIVGLDSLSDVKTFREKYFNSEEIPRFCLFVYNINWILVIFTILISAFKLTPAILKITSILHQRER